MTDWQPIETAPRDGTEILALQVDGRELTYTAVHWETMAEEWRDYSASGAAGFTPFEPQYWMPLPEPPCA